jgi:hypothetical protein
MANTRMMPSYYCKRAFVVCSSASLIWATGQGMETLLDNGDNLLTLVKSTDAIASSYIVERAKNRADKLTASTGKTVLLFITS